MRATDRRTICSRLSARRNRLSIYDVEAFIIAHVTRISTTVWGEGYIPEDNTGDVYLYQGLELMGVAIVVFQVMRLTAVRSSQDVGQGIERWSQVIAMCAVSAILAYFTKSTGHDDYWADLSA